MAVGTLLSDRCCTPANDDELIVNYRSPGPENYYYTDNAALTIASGLRLLGYAHIYSMYAAKYYIIYFFNIKKS